ncbi:MAG: hypothetical protein ACYS1E_18425, partial [Planctomycetota bacterium]
MLVQALNGQVHEDDRPARAAALDLQGHELRVLAGRLLFADGEPSRKSPWLCSTTNAVVSASQRSPSIQTVPSLIGKWYDPPTKPGTFRGRGVQPAPAAC